jgi:DnaJ-class molecular chaperone
MSSPPVGLCTYCGEYTRNHREINYKCLECSKGIYRSHLQLEDWNKCETCNGSATTHGNKLQKCIRCKGSGWILAKAV